MKASMGRKLLLCTMILALAAPLFAQSTDFRVWMNAGDRNGVPVRQGLHVEWFRSIAQDPETGNLCVVWSDTRSGDRDTYAQLYDADGNALWDEGGIAVSAVYGRQEDPHVMPAGNGEWIVTWIDYRYDVDVLDWGDVFIQKLNADGEIMWTDDYYGDGGIMICRAYNHQISVQSFSDGAGGAISIWVDGRFGTADMFVQHTNSDGVRQWTYEGEANDSSGIPMFRAGWDMGNLAGWGYTADTDDAGGIIAAVHDLRETGDQDLYIQRVNNAGELVWGGGTLEGVPLCVNDEDQTQAKLCPDGEGGAFFAWVDKRNDIANGDIWGQHIDAEGNFSWDIDGVVINDFAEKQENHRIVTSGENGAILVWEDRRDEPFHGDLYMQKITNNNGNVETLWDADGVLLCDAPNAQTQARITPTHDGGAFVSWVDERVNLDASADLYAQRIDADGNRLWDTDGIVVSNRLGLQAGNIVRQLNDDRLSVVYSDSRRGSQGIYYQIFDFDGNTIGQEDGNLVVFGLDWDAKVPGIGTVVNNSDADNDYAVVGWIDSRYSFLGGHVHMQRMNLESGVRAWERNGISVTPGYPFGVDENGDPDTTSVTMDSVSFTHDDEYVYIVWEDNRLLYLSNIGVQKLDPATGEMLWGDRALLVAENDDNEQKRPLAQPDGNGGVMVFFEQLNDNWNPNIAMQRVDTDGNPIWVDGEIPGITITNVNYDETLDAVAAFDDESFLVVFTRSNDVGQYDLYGMRVNIDGELMWDEPLLISGAVGNQWYAEAMATDDGIIIAWEDTRITHPLKDIYGQMVHADGTVDWDADGKELYTAQFDETNISLGMHMPTDDFFWMVWEDSRVGNNTDIYAQVYDLSGDVHADAPEGGIAISTAEQSQSAPGVVVMSDGSAFVTWQDIQGQNFSDLRYTRYHIDGNVAEPALNPGMYSDNGNNGTFLCDAYHRQVVLKSVWDEDPDEFGFVSVWEDERATGKDPLFNIYSQRVNEENVTSVGERRYVQPLQWSLEAAYPNPFNPATTISFNLDRSASIRLTVFDVLGRRVASLVSGRVSAGEHSVVWDGRDFGGQMVSSGKYFYRLEADGRQIARSVVLMK
ncbi:T9SS type A sorting domain-containing protein [bacterium]|nr:T9SS type A sorting domain-containing protein [bacterium]